MPGGIECGAIAQLGERLNGIQEVVGSIPIGSTNIETPAGSVRGFFMPFFPMKQTAITPAVARSALRAVLACLSGWPVFYQGGGAERFFERLWFSKRKNSFFCSFFLQE
ncbi:hypothetical protein AA0475_0384 [Acetobacter peroxydans]|nr:hypothetical protein AA13755_2163 [Acetobacter peroxydans NBRC 13755]GBR39877.1 hypothetical protein AA0475_0384 [Acetobacter peroxydans]